MEWLVLSESRGSHHKHVAGVQGSHATHAVISGNSSES